jgi:arylsulfatase A-like enzyme
MDENTLIVFVSDNGGSPLTGAKNTPLTGGRYSLWEGGIRVPMAISWPGKIEAGTVQNHYVSALDILPTITEAAGISLTDETIDGQSLLVPADDRLLVWRWGNTWAARKGHWKLTNANEQWGKGRPTNLYIKPISNDLSLKLFNLDEDAGERNNLARKMPEMVNQLKKDYENWLPKIQGSIKVIQSIISRAAHFCTGKHFWSGVGSAQLGNRSGFACGFAFNC